MGANYLNHVNLARIQWCCDQVNIGLEDLTNHLKFKIEKLQSNSLTYNQLKKLADYFEHSPLFFLEQGLPSEQVHSVAFRSLANQRLKITPNLYRVFRRTEHHRDIYRHFLQELQQEEEQFKPPLLSGVIANQARQVRQWLKLKEDQKYSFDDYRRLLEAKGILIIRARGTTALGK